MYKTQIAKKKQLVKELSVSLSLIGEIPNKGKLVVIGSARSTYFSLLAAFRKDTRKRIFDLNNQIAELEKQEYEYQKQQTAKNRPRSRAVSLEGLTPDQRDYIRETIEFLKGHN